MFFSAEKNQKTFISQPVARYQDLAGNSRRAAGWAF
jgi:hypothetical protein